MTPPCCLQAESPRADFHVVGMLLFILFHVVGILQFILFDVVGMLLFILFDMVGMLLFILFDVVGMLLFILFDVVGMLLFILFDVVGMLLFILFDVVGIYCLFCFTWWRCYCLFYDINQPSWSTPFYSVLVSVSVYKALSTAFHSINSSGNSPFSHSALPVSSLPYWSFQLYASL